MEFILGGVAAMGAGIFTNPLEVLKTRLQLQGELKQKGKHPVYYKNVFHAGYVVIKNDGILALQKGLAPALIVQFILNGVKLGCCDVAESNGYLRDPQGNLRFVPNVLTPGFGAVIGQVLSNPFFLVKTHLQAQAVEAIAVGHQHNHDGLYKALMTIYNAQGVRGLFRGASASVPRAFIGASSQIVSFGYAKSIIEYHEITDNKLLKSFLGSMVGGVAVTLAMTPFDLILTRVYNQPTDSLGRGLVYLSYVDCVTKIYKTEGLRGFYKGFGSMYIRLGPHTIICLVFWDQLKLLYREYVLQKTLKQF